MPEFTERQCGEHSYRVQKFGAKQGLRISARIVRMMGAGVTALVAGRNEAAAAVAMVSALPPDELVALAVEFADSTTVMLNVQSAAGIQKVPQPLGPLFDAHFVDRYDELIEFFVFAAAVNFGKSLMRGKGLGPRLVEIAQLYASRATSNGSGSESSLAAGIT